MGEPGRPEELINHYVTLQTATGNIASALGFLALLWSTVVLLGGFVNVLRLKEFWVLTGLSILMACRVVDSVGKELKRGIYMEEENIIRFVGRQKWIPARVARKRQLWLGIPYLLKFVLFLCLLVLAIIVTPFLSLGVSVWRLVRRDYGDAGGDAANRAKLAAALDIFYALVLLQSLFFMYWASLRSILNLSVLEVAQVTGKQFGDESWIPMVVDMYCLETEKKYKKDGELPCCNWDLITYAVGLLQSASTRDHEDHLWGARLLDKLLDSKDGISKQGARRELLFSSFAIQNLISMIGRRGTADGDIESRDRATSILAHISMDLHIAHFTGTLECICSLLESCTQVCEICPWPEKNSEDEQSGSLETSQRQDIAHLAVPIQDQTDHEQEQAVVSPSAGLAQRKRANFLVRLKEGYKRRQQFKKAINKCRFTYTRRGPKEMVSQGLLILEGLTQDKVNCTEISRHQLLPYKITSPLSSHDFLSNVCDDDTMVEMLGKSLTVLSRLLTCPGDGATRLRQELASTTEAVSNLMAILDTDNKGARQLHQQALEILTELAFDDSFNKLDFNKLFKALLRIFLEEAPSNNTVVQVEQADREKATRLMRGKAGEALARLLPISTARERDVNVADIISKQEAISLLTKVFDQILSSKMETSADAATGAGASNSAAESAAKSELPEQPDSVQPHTQGDEKQSEERMFVAAMLSLAIVIYNENVINREDFARTTPEDAALAKKLKEILKVNKQCTAECLRVAKLTCQMVTATIQAKPGCIQYFNEHNFKEALTEALGTMAEVDNCMLFAGNGRDEVVKPARSLASLVKEARELLNTAQERGN